MNYPSSEDVQATLRRLERIRRKYSPDQSRATNGQFGEGSSSTGPDGPLAAQDAALTSQYATWAAGLSPQVRQLIAGYTRGDNLAWNETLRGMDVDPDAEPVNPAQMQAVQDALLAGRLPQDISAYRMMTGETGDAETNAIWQRLVEGWTLTDKAFGSTSISKAAVEPYARSEGSILMHITIPAGSPGAYLNSLGSDVPQGNYEYLLPHPASYRTVSTSVDQSGQRIARVEYLPESATLLAKTKARTPVPAPAQVRYFAWKPGDIQWTRESPRRRDASEGGTR